jgi:Coat F domain.
MAQIPAFNDKEKVFDSIASQKVTTDAYNTFANECANPEVKGVFMNILNEEHVIQHDLFCELQKRGWYSPAQAEQNKIKTTADKFRKDL